jgi:hypothetical protein
MSEARFADLPQETDSHGQRSGRFEFQLLTSGNALIEGCLSGERPISNEKRPLRRQCSRPDRLKIPVHWPTYGE